MRPPVYGPSTTRYNRFVHWAHKGGWDHVFAELAAAGGEAGSAGVPPASSDASEITKNALALDRTGWFTFPTESKTATALSFRCRHLRAPESRSIPALSLLTVLEIAA